MGERGRRKTPEGKVNMFLVGNGGLRILRWVLNFLKTETVS